MKISRTRVITRDDEPVSKALYSPDAALLVGVGGAVNQPGQVFVWNSDTLDRVASLSTQRPTVASLAFSPDGRWFATSSQTTDTVEIWDVKELRLAKRITILPKPYRRNLSGQVTTETHVGHLAFSQDSRLLAAGCWDLTTKIVALETGTVAELTVPHDRHNVDFVAFVSDATRIITGTCQRLFTWDLVAATHERRADLGVSENWQHCLLEGTDSVFSLSQNGGIRVHHLDTWEFEDYAVQVTPQRLPPSLAFSRLLGLMAIGLFNGAVLLWDVSKRRQVGRFTAGKSPVVAMDFSPRDAVISVVTLSSSERLSEFAL